MCIYICILCINKNMYTIIYIYINYLYYIYIMPLMVKTRRNLFRVKIHKVKMDCVSDDDVYIDVTEDTSHAPRQ